MPKTEQERRPRATNKAGLDFFTASDYDKLRPMLMRLLRYWLPPLLWTAVILAASSDLFSSNHTGNLLRNLLSIVLRGPMRDATFVVIHELVRKSAHLIEYALASSLYYRALQGGTDGWLRKNAATAVLIVVFLATIDEVHQSFVPSRTGSAVDVAIDVLGAFLAQALIHATAIRHRRPGVTLQG